MILESLFWGLLVIIDYSALIQIILINQINVPILLNKGILIKIYCHPKIKS